MTVPDRRRAAGFTLVELVVVICLVAVLLAVAVNRLWDLQEAAEAAAAERNLLSLKAAVVVRSAELAAANRWPDLQRLPAANPFLLLEEVPANYGGEGDDPPPPGYWRYAPAAREVVYRPRRGESFAGGREMRFRLVGVDVGGHPREGAGIAYVKLLPEAEYRWRERVLR